MADKVMRVMSELHARVLSVTKGRVGGSFRNAPVLVLHTTGARSGKRRDAPLLYLEDGDSYAVIASAGGAPSHPGWYHNLLANPDCSVSVANQTIPVHAEILEGEERERAWRGLTALYKSYDAYQEKTDRTIPVMRLRKR